MVFMGISVPTLVNVEIRSKIYCSKNNGALGDANISGLTFMVKSL
jgi:hypothetical protein